MAEVSLVIADTTGSLAIETEELQITRRLYKSGESEYLMNNKVCRLKDIRELFMDTGVSTKCYSIIEQGRVEQLLNTSKTDRRAVFEEAAGISKYNARKKEATAKLDRTEQNLLRVADILGEVQKQLRSIKLQAGKARNYLEYKDKIKELQVNYSLAEYHKIITQSGIKNDSLSEMQDCFSQVAAEVSKNETAASQLGDQIIETENKINASDNSLVSITSKIDQIEQRIGFMKSRIDELAERKTSATQQIEQLDEQKQTFTDDLKKHEDQLEACEKTFEENNTSCVDIEKTLGEINTQCAAIEADLDDEKSGIIDIVRRTAQLHNEIQSISTHKDNLSGQKDRLFGRAENAKAELEGLITEKAQQQVRMTDIEKVLEELDQSLTSKRSESDEVHNLIDKYSQDMAKVKENKSAFCSELALIKDMEERREGLNNTVKEILEKCRDEDGSYKYINGLLADIVEANIKYAAVIEAAVEGKTDALVISNTAQFMQDFIGSDVLQSRVSLICADKLKPFSDKKDLSRFSQIKGRAAEFVKYDSKYASVVWNLLGKVLVVDSVKDAIQLSAKLGSEYKYVTTQGEIVSTAGIVTVGPIAKATGLISRKSQLRQLEETIENSNSQIAQLDEQIAKNSRQNEHLDKLCKDLRTAIYEANTEKMQVSSQINILEQNIKRLGDEQPLICNEIDMLTSQIEKYVQAEYDSKQHLEELETVNAERTAKIEELESSLENKKQQQQEKQHKLTELRIAIGQISEQRKSIRQAMLHIQQQTQQNEMAIETAKTDVDSFKQQTEQTQNDITRCESQISELYIEKETVQTQSKQLHEEVEELIITRKQTEELVRRKRSEQSEIEEKVNNLKIELSQLEVKEQDLSLRVQEDLGMTLADAYEHYSDEDTDWDAVREEIAGLRGKIERLGNVNIDAINQQAELVEREEFLASQVEDLNNSKVNLQQLINRLNKESREKFRETFEAIRIQFQEIFRKLFGGGKADILLEDAEDILEAGIEIIARPPGKETRSISLLSGGEKTMTAIALLFAVFKAKPSPFCFLDEVDAALDEANNERFNMIVREFQQYSQFIIVTHSKRTMSIADVLYGVTMQVKGVSKKIGIQFDSYNPQTAEEEVAVA